MIKEKNHTTDSARFEKMASCGGEKKKQKNIIPLEALLTSKEENKFKVEIFLWWTTYNY